jgi:hypothetical protein
MMSTHTYICTHTHTHTHTHTCLAFIPLGAYFYNEITILLHSEIKLVKIMHSICNASPNFLKQATDTLKM